MYTDIFESVREEGSSSQIQKAELSDKVCKGSTQIKKAELVDQVCKGAQPYTGLASLARETDKVHNQRKETVQRIDRKKVSLGK